MAIQAVSWPAASQWRAVLTRSWKEAGDDNVGLLAAGVAFYGFLAFVPLLAAVVLTYGLVAEPETVARHIEALFGALPRDAAALIADQLRSMTESDKGAKGLGLLVSLALAIYGASKGAGAIVTALNIAYEVKETRSFVRTTLLSLAMTVGALVVLVIAAVAISGMSAIESLLPASSPALHTGLQIIFWSAAAAAVSLAVALVYRHAPNRPDAPWRWISPGSAAATLLWLLASLGFGFYVKSFGNYNATYGSLGGVVVFLTWLYLSGYILLMGGELNSELERQQAMEAKEEAAAAAPPPEPAPTPAPALRQPSPSRPQAARRPRLAGIAALLGAGWALGRLRRRAPGKAYRDGPLTPPELRPAPGTR